MKQLSQVFNYEGANVRTVIVGGEPWFVAKDVCDVLAITNSTIAVQRLDDDEVTKFNLGGLAGESNIVSESGLYSLILGSRKPEARAFKRWVTHEVLPSIRKTGAYTAPAAVPSYAIEDPIERAKRWITEEEERRTLQLETGRQAAILAEQAPKVSYYEKILRSPDAISVTQIASDYGITPQLLNDFLREHGIQRKTGRQWVLRREYADKGFTKSETTTFGEGGTRVYTKWTQEGRLLIDRLLTEHGIPNRPARKKSRRNESSRKPRSATVTITLN
ncbi:phage antirepressor [Mycobacterium gordonae]|nr:phage antirepressor [Mycobacterium gordonae]